VPALDPAVKDTPYSTASHMDSYQTDWAKAVPFAVVGALAAQEAGPCRSSSLKTDIYSSSKDSIWQAGSLGDSSSTSAPSTITVVLHCHEVINLLGRQALT
jgi:hypothetical protein